jgi:hypothetical protein
MNCCCFVIAGSFGLIGSITFAIFSPMTSTNYLSWAYALATASSCFVIAFASVIAYFRRRGLDVRNYSADNAIHYSPSEGVVIPGEFRGGGGFPREFSSSELHRMNLAPPPYSEVVGQPPSIPGASGHAQVGERMKPVIPGDLPPAYFPPPSSGHFQAPPPYAPPSQLVGIPPSSPPSSSAIPPAQRVGGGGDSASPTVRGGGGGVGINSEHSNIPPAVSQPPTTGSTNDDESAADLPVYYVTVLGQAVPVFQEELQQAGMNESTALPVPAYFIEMQGHHVPVYSEEQARQLTGQI